MTTVLQKPPAAKMLTYAAYVAEGEIKRRYDILDGERIFMPSPTRQHQTHLRKIARPLEDYADATGAGQAFVAPCDVLITRRPLRVRQPDVLFISAARLAQNTPAEIASPLQPAPELIIEIASPSDTDRALEEKITDYCFVGVEDAWIARPALRTVEVLRLSPAGYASVRIYRAGEQAQSITFPGLFVDVDAIFAE